MNILNRGLRTLLLGCVLAVASAVHADVGTKALTNYVGCVNDPLPLFPAVPSYQLVNSNAIGLVDVVVWRQICLNNPNDSMILIKIAPYPIGESLVTGSNITAIQNGLTIGPFTLLQTTRDVAGYTGYLNQGTTFILAQTNNLPALLNENGAFQIVFRAGHDTATLDIPTRGFEDVVLAKIIEYFNTTTKHYFMTANPAEIAILDAGGAGGGWTRTGQSVTVAYNSVAAGTLPVCRFYARPPGPNTHFYTVDPNECVIVHKDPRWTFEGVAFYASPVPPNNPCSVIGQRPVYRFYNNRHAQNDSNHRYVVDTSLFTATQAQGYVNEGVVMCVPFI